jgi:hypothetical protein
MGLSLAKQAELQRALDAAKADLAAPPPAALLPLADSAAALPPERIADTNLNIVRHKDSGCIQFIFPAPHGVRPALLAPAARSRWEWIVQAALRAREQLTQSMIEKIEAANKPETLLSLRHPGPLPATAAELAASRGRKVLLLVHGVFSSTAGAFGDLAADDTMRQLLARYDGQVFGYDHWTLAKTPQQNALDLLSHLPADAGWQVDIVCHSRGGLVVRSLLSHSDDPTLAAIARRRAGRIASVGKAFFVAAANQGSPLASPEDIRHFLNVAAMLASFSGGMALDLVIALARMVVSLGFGRPSVEALASGSALIGQLDRAGTLLTSASTWYARADFDYGSSMLARTGAMLNRLLLDTDNDVVVPYVGVPLPGMPIADGHVLDLGTPQRRQSEIWHTELFKSPATRDFLLKRLG